MKVRRSLLKDSVQVSTYLGEGAYGPVYAPPVTVRCNLQAGRRLVRNQAGDEVVSEAVLQLHPDDAAALVPESKLAIAGRSSTVLTTKPHSWRGTDTLIEVTCS